MRTGPRETHWDSVHGRKSPEEQSWFQPSLERSLDLIADLAVPSSANIIDVGGGSATLADDLLARGYENLCVLDISQVALDLARSRLGAQASKVEWIRGDVTEVELPEGRYDVWHDRAVFHFLLSPDARKRYVEQTYRAVRPGGHIIAATFGLRGPEQCSGLAIVRYDASTLHDEFGARFAVIRQLEERHVTPAGAEQEFLYCLLRRES